MKNHLPLAFAAAALLVTPAFTSAWAADLRTIAITGHGEAHGRPDTATIQAGVTTNAPTAAAALAANSSRMSAVFAALKKMGVPDRNIQTSGFSVFPQYTNGDNNNARRLTGYQVSNNVSVKLEDVDRTGPALDALVTAGANQMNGVSFDIAKPAPLLDQARADAVTDARHRAEVYAKAAGISLGSIQSISEGGGEAPRPMYRMAAMAMPAPPPPMAPGEQTISADVTMVWEIH
jgi:uncharacterized protein YggE